MIHIRFWESTIILQRVRFFAEKFIKFVKFEGSGLVQHFTKNKLSMIVLSAFVDIQHKESQIHIANYSTCTFYQNSWSNGFWWNQFVTIWLAYTKLKNNTSFLYWKCVINLQIKVLYVRSIREGKFKLHVEVLYKLLS